MAKWFKDYLSFGSRRSPPQPPKPDYTESEILKAYRAQKSLDFEDPYEDQDHTPKGELGPGVTGSPNKTGGSEVKFMSPKHRLIKVESSDLNRSKVLLARMEEVKTIQEQVTGNSEYSDPFDVHQESVGSTEEEQGQESNGYIEPYEAQRAITEFNWKSERQGRRVKKFRKGVQLYDTPYEENGGGESECESPIGSRPRESRLPQDDERPADEYDQPWEWKKDHISRAFAVQFENPEWEHMSPTSKERLLSAKPMSPLAGRGRYTGCTQSPERSLVMGEKVDLSLPLEKQVWYHGAISRADAENLLVLCKECSYLVRNSQTSQSDYSLSLRSTQGFMHMKFTRTKDNKYILGQNSAPFESICEVIHHYTSRKLPVKGAEHLSLLYPVPVQTL
ncbi:SH2 domain-containing adapter protein D [Microcaecilia unicolor]|uniref:SH2 domain-containing adapter protein D n=1 Tax=Microcaecilia unicolor TaxID=1415580 RepID=A0A6P7ZJL4_9AMPH|nr:SH2 domain-containing adapter protein D [Microcaecilia unicolor]